MPLRNLLLIFALLLAGKPAWAEEQPPSGWLTRMELKEHRKLVEMIRQGAELQPFATDGCSGGMSWLWAQTVKGFPDLGPVDGKRPEWEECCVTHDRAYHNASGQTRAGPSYFARLRADQDLQVCIREIGTRPHTIELPLNTDLGTLYDRLSDAMFWAVRFGGEPCSGLSWRWGYGFPDC